MNRNPNISVRPNGRFINIDADGAEVGYLLLAHDRSVTHSWAYDYDDLWLIRAVSECYQLAMRAVWPDCYPTPQSQQASSD
jgi:hypothetical protein